MTLDPDTIEAIAATSLMQPDEVIRPGKDEMNLAEFPITLLTDRVPKGKTVIQYQDKIFDEKSGKQITRKLTISADEANGLPTAVDDDVILGLIQLTKLVNGFTSREVEFNRMELIRLLGWPDSGDSYRRLTISLKRWLSVTLLYENAWRDNRQGAWTTKGFHILDNIELNHSRAAGSQGELFLSKITWNKVVFESFEAGYLKSIDYGLYVKFKLPTTKRLYRFLSKRMYHGPEMTFELRDLCITHTGLSPTYSGNAGKLKEKLEPALEELESVGFLLPMAKEERYQKTGKVWKVHLKCQTPAPALPEAAAVASPIPPLVSELIKWGVTDTVAAELVRQYPAEKIQAKIEELDWQMTQPKPPKRPAGYLVKSITTGKDGYQTPKGFISKAEQQRQKEAEKARERQAAERKRLERQKEARERAELQLIDRHWKSLSADDQAQLDTDSKAKADPETLALERGPMKSFGESIRRRNYIRELLQAEGKLPLPQE